MSYECHTKEIEVNDYRVHPLREDAYLKMMINKKRVPFKMERSCTG